MIFSKTEPAQFLDIVRASSERKEEAVRRLDYYHDDQFDDLFQMIAKKWVMDKGDVFPLVTVNLVKKIVNKLASVYQDWPTRTFSASEDTCADAYRHMKANRELKKASRLTKLLKAGALQVWHDGTGPRLSYVGPQILDVVHDGDPERPTRIIVTHKAARAEHVEYSDWTADTYTRRDYMGRPIPVEGNESGVNPYGMLPFVGLWDRAPDDEFFIPGGADLIGAQDHVNLILSNLGRALEWQSHGQAVLIGGTGDEDVAVGPSSVIRLPTGSDLKFEQPKTPVSEVLAEVEFIIRQTAIMNGLSADVFRLDSKAESGAAKMAERMDLAEARRDDVDLWRDYETALFDVVKAVVNVHAPGSIREDAEISVDFADVSDPAADAEWLKAAQMRMAMGLWSPVDALMDQNPDITDREDAVRILQEKQREGAMISENSSNFGAV
jgi:hypothetical protein